MENPNSSATTPLATVAGSACARARRYDLIVILFAAFTYFTCLISPPSLMDDVDAVQAQIARTMVDSGDWVSAHLDGIAYLEKAPLKYWLIAICFKIFGIHDWAARIPIALSVVLLCLVTARFARWAMGELAGLYAGIILSTCVGIFLFTRVLIPDVVLTLTITLAMWSFLRVSDGEEERPLLWAMCFWAAMACGVLLKGLIALVFPAGAAVVYLVITGKFKHREMWRRFRFLPGIALFLAIAAPWHILATLRNPPYFDFTMHSESGSYHGFFWFYFINEQVLRFLNKRYPRDYNTVPRALFWLLHLLWLFPWSVYFGSLLKVRYRGEDRASSARLLALCWAGFVLCFFTFSTTQEYYSMPAYPAMAILLASAMVSEDGWLRPATRVVAFIAAVAAVVIGFLLWNVRSLAAPGDISVALTSNPDVYTLSLGHMADLTFSAFAYLRLPLAIAFIATLAGAAGAWILPFRRAVWALALMMVVFLQAARAALVVFDPYLSTRPLAEALNRAPEGQLIVDDQYYTFSSVFFYSNRTALLLNGRVNNLEYGSYRPGAPQVFIKDSDLADLWNHPQRYYLIAENPQIPRLDKLVGADRLHVVAASGGKTLFANR
jgi:4-amino-4-deoxy-L-arabinose transferase-like glycosyltransferase